MISGLSVIDKYGHSVSASFIMQTDITQFIPVAVVLVIYLAALLIIDRKKIKTE